MFSVATTVQARDFNFCIVLTRSDCMKRFYGSTLELTGHQQPAAPWDDLITI
jgi:hypothetical protein